MPSKIEQYTITEIGYRALAGLPKLQFIFIPSTIQRFKGDAFAFNHCLEEIIFEENSQLQSLSFYAFYECKAMKVVTIPKSVISILDHSFAAMDSLMNIYIQNCYYIDKDRANSMFEYTNCSKIKIFVPKNYPITQFAGVDVEKVLPPFYQPKLNCCTNKITIICHYSPLLIILLL